ncbi:conserved hypothetical protein [Theileria equi strain WA]|uniref:phosphoinositide 5-phosphatase n=1 Tax=Theileria equi strain WA TaxID=1537102 RepID=L1LFU1_THEEQ|nr:conserved hypothetical protein [Theileria equi strain WA]EKX74277.1 conserved hypothetical protein [Theileria equi strain WA]|eukprot:XP_004833729.1 conserved hypothetical protein [Theileria equi strain WA]
MDTTFVLTAFKSWYYIAVHESLEQTVANLKGLWIDRSTCQVIESSTPMTKELPLYELSLDVILGIFQVAGSYCLALVTKSELVADVFLDQATCYGKDTSKIYAVKAVKCLSLEHDLIDPSSEDFIRLSSNSSQVIGENDNFVSRIGQANTATSWFSNIKLPTKDYENNTTQGQPDLARSLQGLERLLSNGYYFSFDTDLTRSLQRLALGGYLPIPKISLVANLTESNLLSTNEINPSTLWDIADKGFNWSHFLADNLPKHWITPLIQGYVGYSINYENGSRVELLLIARRSILRSGTRFYARGIDEYGNTANFTESELRVRVDGKGWKSFVQVRGSVPIFWKQELITSHPVITRSSECTLEAFKRHIDILRKLCEEPSKICCVNLLELKEAEQILTDAFTEQIKLYNSDCVELINFNYTSQTKWAHINTVLIKFISDNLAQLMEKMTYFDSESYKAHIMADHIGEKMELILQRGLFRINCLDSLDRTNGMQWMIAWVWLTKIIDPKGELGLLAYKQEEDALFQNFTELWCAHGDSISIHYAGTPSILTEQVRQGRTNFGSIIHFAKTMVDRAYTSIFEDCSRQEYFDIILGTHKQLHPQNSKKNHLDNIYTPPTEVNQSELKIWCGSWNIGGNNISEDDDLHDWIGAKRVQSDIYMFCLQEFVELTAVNVVINKTDYSKELLFNNKISNILTMYGSYSKVKSVSMIGLYLVVYAKESLKQHIYNIDVTNVKTGLNCNAGNKGAIGIKFNLYGQKIALINVHLNSGKTPQTGRMDLLQHIIHNSFQEKEYNSLSNQDLFIIGGDFNFQVQLDKSQTIELMRRMEYQRMLEYDEFRMGKMMGIHFLRNLQEADIDFQPTYKYKTGTQFYTFKRTPAWCDRIIYGGRSSGYDTNDVRSLYYTRHDRFYSSDHKPVSSVIVLKLKKRPVDSGRISIDEPLIEF